VAIFNCGGIDLITGCQMEESWANFRTSHVYVMSTGNKVVVIHKWDKHHRHLLQKLQHQPEYLFGIKRVVSQLF
jgi:hypothetical protein